MKRIISLLLALILFLGAVPPVTVSAEEAAQTEPTAILEEAVETEPVEIAEEMVETEPAETAEAVVETEPVETTEEVVETEPVETTEEVIETEPVETTEEVVETEPVETTQTVEETEPTESTVPEKEEILTEDTLEASTVSEQYILDQINQGKKQFALAKDVVLENDFVLPEDVFVQFNGHTIRVPDGKTLTVEGQLGYWWEKGGLIVESNAYLNNWGYIGTSGILKIWGQYEGRYVHTQYIIGGSNADIQGLSNDNIWMHYVVEKANPQAEHQDLFVQYLNLVHSTDYAYYSLQLHGNLTLPYDIIIPYNCYFHMEGPAFTLTIPSGCKITNFGEFYVWEEQTVLNYGTFENFGYLDVMGNWWGNEAVKPRMTQDQFEYVMNDVPYYYSLMAEVVLERDLTIDKDLYIYSGGKLVVPQGVKLTVEGSVMVGAEGTLDVQGSYELVESEDEYRCIEFWYTDGVFGSIKGVKIADLTLNCDIYNDAQLKQALHMAANNSYAEERIFIYENVTVPSNAVIPNKCFVYLYRDVTLNVPSGYKLVNKGNLYVWEGATLQNNGTIENNQYLYVEGKLVNNAKITVNEKGTLFVDESGHVKNYGTVTCYGEFEQQGVWEGSDPVIPHVHTYTGEVTYPTCTKEGYTTYTCSCGYSYVGSKVPALGHDYVDGICSRCDEAALNRVSGTGRCQTAIEAAKKLRTLQGGSRFNAIVVADGDNYPDALSGSYLAAVAKAPILLVQKENAGTQTSVLNYIKYNLNLAKGTVYILGGKNSVTEEFANSIADYAGNNVKVVRLAGSGRYATSLKIIQEADKLQGKKSNKILVCDGTGYADSLSASATGLPILLVNGKETSLTAAQISYLKSVPNANIFVIGGTNSVSEQIRTALNKLDADGNAKRLSGSGREQTSVAVAREFFPNPTFVVLADGNNYPDGLSGGPLAYAKKAPLLLIREGREASAKSYIGTRVQEAYILGGKSSVTDTSVQNIFGSNCFIK